MPSQEGKLHFGYADGFRALAVIYVFAYHLMLTAPTLKYHLQLADFLIFFDPISMFFVLSGYLLTGPFVKAYLRDNANFPKVGPYLAARLLRNYPLYFIALVAVSLFEWLNHAPPGVWDFVSHALLIYDFSSKTTQSISGPFWTLAVDFEFYLALPVIFWCLVKAKPSIPPEKRTSALLWTLVGIGVASIVYRYIAWMLIRPASWEVEIVYIHQLPGMLCIFVAGIGARALLESASAQRKAFLIRISWPLIILSLCTRPISVFILNYNDRLQHWMIGHFDFGTTVLALQDGFNATACAMLLVALAVRPTNPIAKLLSGKPFAIAASLSYCFYLFHLTVIETIAGGHTPEPSWGLLARTATLSLVILIPLCYVLVRYVETPFLAMKSSLQRSRTAETTPTITDVVRPAQTHGAGQLLSGAPEQA